MDRIRIEPMRAGDLVVVSHVERACFDDPWDDRELRHLFRRRDGVSRVARRLGWPIGYVMCVVDGSEVAIMTLAVVPHYRRRGVGTMLVDALKERVCRGRRECVSAWVRERNLPAQLFFRSCGFRWVETERLPWAGLDEDAYVMEWKIGGFVPRNRIAALLQRNL